MSMHEEIARLTGKLVFQADTSPLVAFMQKLKTSEATLNQFAAKFGKAHKLRLDTSAITKAQTEVRNLEKQLNKLNARKSVAVHVDKQINAPGSKATQAVKSQASAGVTAAQAREAKLKAALDIANEKLKAAQATTAGKLHTSRMAAQKLVQQAQTHGQAMANKMGLHNQTRNNRQTKANLVQQGLAAKNNATVARLQATPARRSTGHGGMAYVFAHSGSHHTQHAIHGMASGIGHMGTTTSSFGDVLGGLTSALNGPIGMLGGFGLAVGAATAVLGAFHDRVEARQNSASDSEQYKLGLQAASDDPDIARRVAEAYRSNSMEFANKIDTQGARDNSAEFYKLHDIGGLDVDKALEAQKAKALIKRSANMKGVDERVFDQELSNLLIKGKLDSRQTNAFLNHARVASGPIAVGAARQAGYTGDDVNEARAYMVKKNGGKAWQMTRDQGVAGLLYAGQDEHLKAFAERHSNSIEADQTKLDNQQYLQRVDQEQGTDLQSAIHDRINAENELSKAMAPVQEGFVQLDILLTKLETGALKTMADWFGKKTPDEEAKKNANMGMASEAPAIDPRALNGKGNSVWSEDPRVRRQQEKDAHDNDPISRFYNWFTGNNKKPVLGELPDPSNFDALADKFRPKASMDDALNTTSKPSFMPSLFQTFDSMQRNMDDSNKPTSPGAYPSQVFNNPITVEGATINVEIKGSATEQDAKNFLDIVKHEIDSTMSSGLKNAAQGAVTDMLGRARSLQTEYK